MAGWIPSAGTAAMPFSEEPHLNGSAGQAVFAQQWRACVLLPRPPCRDDTVAELVLTLSCVIHKRETVTCPPTPTHPPLPHPPPAPLPDSTPLIQLTMGWNLTACSFRLIYAAPPRPAAKRPKPAVSPRFCRGAEQLWVTSTTTTIFCVSVTTDRERGELEEVEGVSQNGTTVVLAQSEGCFVAGVGLSAPAGGAVLVCGSQPSLLFLEADFPRPHLQGGWGGRVVQCNGYRTGPATGSAPMQDYHAIAHLSEMPLQICPAGLWVKMGWSSPSRYSLTVSHTHPTDWHSRGRTPANK
ncbi:hypothetical protein JZ751_006343 [Albula glossodonta]|uniref:Uncharacterized protein n=1 Tax=Albula glossodonta TaxID=121402 RepID=A0A8T2N4M2_9TELE|nr:hypothetical protein JZ751_006343 [Albula glossodonta]